MKSSPLKWIPLPINPTIRPPRGLRDFQVGWFWNLFFASLDQESIGYLPVSENLWMIAGAHARDRWERNGAAVIAAFDTVELVGRGKFIFYGPLKPYIEDAKERIRGKKKLPPTDEDFHKINNHPQNNRDLCPVEVGFDVGSKKTKEEVCPEIPESVQIRNELERQDGIANAKARGFIRSEDGGWYHPKLVG